MKLWDILLTGTIVVGAIYYLYRKIIVNKGCSCGSSCSQKPGSCHSKKKDS